MAVQTIENPANIAEEHRRLIERITFIMRNADEPMSISDLAETAGLSPFYFSRIFREYAGIPPGEFQAALRFDRAKHLLLTSPASITEICFEVGYESLGTFSSRFKNLVGVSPAEFRALPHIIADMDFRKSIESKPRPDAPGSAVIEGEVYLPDNSMRTVYVGIFPDAIASSFPIAGLTLSEPGPFRLTGIPVGTWTLLSAALPYSSDPLVHLLPRPNLLVSSGGKLTVRDGTERFHRSLRFHKPRLNAPPVLTALPALLL